MGGQTGEPEGSKAGPEGSGGEGFGTGAADTGTTWAPEGAAKGPEGPVTQEAGSEDPAEGRPAQGGRHGRDPRPVMPRVGPVCVGAVGVVALTAAVGPTWGATQVRFPAASGAQLLIEPPAFGQAAAPLFAAPPRAAQEACWDRGWAWPHPGSAQTWHPLGHRPPAGAPEQPPKLNEKQIGSPPEVLYAFPTKPGGILGRYVSE